MLRKIIIALIILYGLQVWLVDTARRMDEAQCKGWECREVWCPPTYSIKTPNGDYIECEKLDNYLKETEL